VKPPIEVALGRDAIIIIRLETSPVIDRIEITLTIDRAEIAHQIGRIEITPMIEIEIIPGIGTGMIPVIGDSIAETNPGTLTAQGIDLE
jgi:hypothetical protein